MYKNKIIILLIMIMCGFSRSALSLAYPESEHINLDIAAKNLSITMGQEYLLDNLDKFPNLEELSISCLEETKNLPYSLGHLKKLQKLNIDNGNGCSMKIALPQSITKLKSLRVLILYGAMDNRMYPEDKRDANNLLPKTMQEMKALESLNLGHNQLKNIPDSVFTIPFLKDLDFSFNDLEALPDGLLSLRSLETLDLSGNDLKSLPNFIHKLPKLSKIKLGNNCQITQSECEKHNLQNRFPKIEFDFNDEFDCPEAAI